MNQQRALLAAVAKTIVAAAVGLPAAQVATIGLAAVIDAWAKKTSKPKADLRKSLTRVQKALAESPEYRTVVSDSTLNAALEALERHTPNAKQLNEVERDPIKAAGLVIRRGQVAEEYKAAVSSLLTITYGLLLNESDFVDLLRADKERRDLELHKTIRTTADTTQRIEDRVRALSPPPAPDPGTTLKSWRAYVANRCSRLDTFGPDDEVKPRSLQSLYVDLLVGGEPDRRSDAPREQVGPSSGGYRVQELLEASLTRARPASSDPAGDHPGAATRHWVVLGDPGSGKTTLLRALAHDYAQRKSSPFVPAYLVAADRWDSETNFIDHLATEASRISSTANRDSTAELLRRAGESGDPKPLLLLVDGLDEISRKARNETRDWLAGLARDFPEARVVVTTRRVPYEEVGDPFRELALQPLDEASRIELVARYLAEEDEPEEETKARARLIIYDLRPKTGRPWLWEWAGNPLYLSFLALLIRQGKTPSRLRHKLYGQVVDLMLEGKHRPRGEKAKVKGPKAVRHLLPIFAYRMTVHEEETGTDEAEVSLEWLTQLLLEETEELKKARRKLEGASPRFYGEDVERVFSELQRTGILGVHARPDWRFLHRTIREALTAEYMARQAATEGGMERLLARAADLGKDAPYVDWANPPDDLARWAEPFALLAGQVEDRDGLVLALVGANRELGLRALASTHDLRPETLKELLDRVKGNEDRAAVIRSFPQVLASPAAVLDLVDELRRGTRNGDDLFWLYWVVQEVEGRAAEEGNRELAAAARDRLDRFFDHIEAPEAKMFRLVETGKFGQRPLWCTIPPEDHAGPGDGVVGSFRMGSPTKEKGRFDREGPQHRVEFRSRFRLAAVPVTRAQYALFDPEHESFEFDGIPKEELPHHPVNQVSWWAAVSFCRWLSRSLPELAGARLPTEAEWEYACRAGTETAYWKGNGEAALKKVGWYHGNSDGRTHRVGELPANDWGLHDVHGNVDEWTLSPWTKDYSGRQDGTTEDPGRLDAEALIGIDPGGGGRVVRGGSYADDARWARSAYRSGGHPGFVFRSLGFRVALPAAPSDLRR